MKVRQKVSPEDIDKLLNSFLDGELPPRQLGEVKRLLAGNKNLAHRLEQLRKCRTLIQITPFDDAPAGLMADILGTVEKKAEQHRKAVAAIAPRGARHLFLRKMMTAAAIIDLIEVLGAVVYSILAPAPTSPTNMANNLATSRQNSNQSPSAVTIDFSCRLEIATATFIESTDSINRLLRDTNMEDFVDIDRTKPHEMMYTIICPATKLNTMIESLKAGWSKFDSAMLVVRAESPADRIVISDLKVDQLGEIIAQNDGEKCIRAARYFAITNDMSRLPDNVNTENLPQIENPDSMSIPKPVLTGEQASDKGEGSSAVVSMTIIVSAKQ